jgi:hypothetical protein
LRCTHFQEDTNAPDHPKNQSLKIATFPLYSLRWPDQLTTRFVTEYTVIGSNDLRLVFTLVVKKTSSTDTLDDHSFLIFHP